MTQFDDFADGSVRSLGLPLRTWWLWDGEGSERVRASCHWDVVVEAPMPWVDRDFDDEGQSMPLVVRGELHRCTCGQWAARCPRCTARRPTAERLDEP